jgi:hypothetical protein
MARFESVGGAIKFVQKSCVHCLQAWPCMVPLALRNLRCTAIRVATVCSSALIISIGEALLQFHVHNATPPGGECHDYFDSSNFCNKKTPCLLPPCAPPRPGEPPEAVDGCAPLCCLPTEDVSFPRTGHSCNGAALVRIPYSPRG